jgi:hypothetical protein
LEVRPQDLDQERRDGEHAPAGAALRLLHVLREAVDFLQGPDDPHLAPKKVQALTLEPHQLPPPAAEVDGRIDERPKVRVDHGRQALHLLDGQVEVLAVGHSGEHDALAGRLGNQARGHRCIKDALQDLVTHPHRTGCETGGAQVLHPRLDLPALQPPERKILEGGQDVIPEIALVPGKAGPPEVQAIVQPLAG